MVVEEEEEEEEGEEEGEVVVPIEIVKLASGLRGVHVVINAVRREYRLVVEAKLYRNHAVAHVHIH